MKERILVSVPVSKNMAARLILETDEGDIDFELSSEAAEALGLCLVGMAEAYDAKQEGVVN